MLADRPSGRLRNLSLAAAISLGFCGFLKYDDLAHIRIEGISMFFLGAFMDIFLDSGKNDEYRQGSHILLSAINCYACPVQLTALLIQNAGRVDGSRPLLPAASVHEEAGGLWQHPYFLSAFEEGCCRGVPGGGFTTKVWPAFREGWRCHFGSQLCGSHRLWMELGGWRSSESAVGYVKTSQGQSHQVHRPYATAEQSNRLNDHRNRGSAQGRPGRVLHGCCVDDNQPE